MSSITWQRINKYCQQSQCQRYRITAARVGKNLMYLPWVKTSNNWQPLTPGSAENAREQIEHYDGHC